MLGNRAIAFLLAPLYSYYLSTEQYGIMDLISSTSILLYPVVCLGVYDATFRFANDKRFSDKEIISSSLALCIPGAILYGFLFMLLAFRSESNYILYVGAFVLFDAINNILAQYLRGKNRMIAFGLTGIINSVVLLTTNIIFMIAIKMQLEGWCLSALLARIANLLFVVFVVGFSNIISIKSINKRIIIELLRYSLPLMPNTIMWWILNLSNRYVLAFFIGTAATGIYAVGNKIPSLLSMMENAFYQAWQISSIDALDQKNRNDYYSDVFCNYFYVLTIGVLGILIIGKYAIAHLFAADYYSAWICLAPLTICVMIHALAGNLGIVYTTFMETKGALFTSIWGAISNIVLIIFLIPALGVLGAAITTFLGYMVIFMARWIDIKKYVTFHINKRKIVFYSFLICLQLVLYYIPGHAILIGGSIVFLIPLYLDRNLIMKIIINK